MCSKSDNQTAISGIISLLEKDQCQSRWNLYQENLNVETLDF